MSYKIEYADSINEDIKRLRKQNFDIQEFKDIVKILESEGKLPSEYNSHKLKGKFKGYWECHIEPNWLLIWKKSEKSKRILFARTGSHLDLF